jgi:hypothetical protein
LEAAAVVKKLGGRVTRLGEFFPIGRLLSLDSFLKITEVAQSFVLLFSTEKSYVLILTKKGWATFLPIFSQTHLVTLLGGRARVHPNPTRIDVKGKKGMLQEVGQYKGEGEGRRVARLHVSIPKNPQIGTILEGRGMENVGICISWPYGIFMTIWIILWQFGISIVWSFGIFFPVLVCSTKNNLATPEGG